MKDVLRLDDKTFISATQAAALSGYSVDYIGQLCRQGKVAGRMIGRAWYVDCENNFLKGKVANLVLPRLAREEPRYVSKIKYTPESAPTLPKLNKLVVYPVGPTLTKKITKPFIAVVLFSALSLSAWFAYFSPRQAEISMNAITKLPSMLVSLVQQSNFMTADVQTAVNDGVTAPSSGIVAFPDSGSHDANVAAVQNAFSDEVNVQFDASGASGVITPIFRTASTTNGYAFVMVPINTK